MEFLVPSFTLAKPDIWRVDQQIEDIPLSLSIPQGDENKTLKRYQHSILKNDTAPSPNPSPCILELPSLQKLLAFINSQASGILL